MSWSEEQRQTLEGGSTHRLSFCQSKFLGVRLHQGDGSSGMLQEPAGLPGTQACKSLSGLKEEGIWNWEWARQDFALWKAAQGKPDLLNPNTPLPGQIRLCYPQVLQYALPAARHRSTGKNNQYLMVCLLQWVLIFLCLDIAALWHHRIRKDRAP